MTGSLGFPHAFSQQPWQTRKSPRFLAPGTLYLELPDEVDWSRSPQHGAQPSDSVDLSRMMWMMFIEETIDFHGLSTYMCVYSRVNDMILYDMT